jgi:gluconate kinase
MSVKVFVLGRSGSGKSTVACRIIELAQRRSYQARRMKDYHLLYKMYQEDTTGDNFQPAAHGGFHVKNYAVFDKALEELEEDVTRKISEDPDDIVTIEFARGSYNDAFRKFSPDFIQNAYFFFVDAGVETCIERIGKRVTDPPTSDHHYVPEEIMRKYFDKNNWSYMSDEFKRDYRINKEVVLYYNTGSIEDLYAQVDLFAETIFANEFSTPLSEGKKTLEEQLV